MLKHDLNPIGTCTYSSNAWVTLNLTFPAIGQNSKRVNNSLREKIVDIFFWSYHWSWQTAWRVSKFQVPTLWKFVADNYTEKYDALKFTLKNNIKDDSSEHHTEIIPLLFRYAWNR